MINSALRWTWPLPRKYQRADFQYRSKIRSKIRSANWLPVIAFCLILMSAPLLAVELTQRNTEGHLIDLSGKALILQDTNNLYRPQTALAKFKSPDFQSASLDTNGKHYWHYLPIYNSTKEPDWTLVSNNALFDDLDFYWHCEHQPLVKLPRPKMGLASKSIDTSYNVALTIPSNTKCGILQEVSVVSTYPLQNYLMTASHAEQRSKFQTIVSVLAFGVIIGLAIYNLLLSISLSNINYLFYSAYAFVNLSTLILITFRPFSSYYYLLPSMNLFRITGASASVLFILFTIRFVRPGLEIAKKENKDSVFLPVCETLLRWRFLPCGIMLFFIAEALFSPSTLGATGKAYPLLYIACSFYIPVVSLVILLTGYRPAFVFLIAWSLLTAGNVSGFLDLMGLIELNGWARTIAIVGASLEMVLLSIALAMNIRESQKAEERAQRAREKAETLMQRQDKFVSTLSHEIRTPLHAILGATNLLAKTELNATQKDYWNTTHYAAESMHALVDNLLDHAEAKDTQRLDEKVNFDPKRLFEAMIQLLKPRALEKNLPVTLNMHEVPDELLGNPLVIRRLLINLISNSIKYTDQGAIDISVVWQATAKRLTIIISDTGKGLSEIHLKQLNTRFNKGLESYYSQESSSGLGLAICHELIANSGGQLTIESELNLGTTVTVELGLELPTSSAILPTPFQAKSPSSLSARVLVVDDLASNRLIAEQIIKQSGCTTLSATNGREALDILATQHIDILISDLRMPEMDGAELVRNLKQIESVFSRKLPRIVITSAHLTTAKKEELFALDADACLAKPYRPEQLASTITNLLNDDSKQFKKRTNAIVTKQTIEPTPIDDVKPAVATSVADHLGVKVYGEVVDLFEQQTAEDIKRIQQGLKDKNIETISIAAHRIVSASKALGFTDIAYIAAKVEKTCIDKPQPLTHSLAKKVEHNLSLLTEQIDAQIQKAPPKPI